MRLNRIFPGLALGAALLLGNGCGGVSATHSVSPATFLLPGLLQATPPAKDLTPDPAPEPIRTIAQAR